MKELLKRFFRKALPPASPAGGEPYLGILEEVKADRLSVRGLSAGENLRLMFNLSRSSRKSRERLPFL